MEAVGKFLVGSPLVTDQRSVVLIHVNLFVYSLCFWIQQPVLPFLSSELGADAVAFGTLQTIVSGMALAGGAMMGRLTDTKGAKTTLVVSHAGSFAMYGLMTVATSFPILVASRLPAFLQHAMLCAQAAISSLAPAEARSAALGRLSLSYALGMVIGSPLGGNLATLVGYRGAAACSAVVTLVVIILDVVFLPELKVRKDKDEKAETCDISTAPQSSLFGLATQAKAFFQVLLAPQMLQLLVVIFPISLGIGAFRSMLAHAGKEAYGLGSSELGWFMSFAAMVGLVTNVFCIKPITSRLGDFYSVVCASVVESSSYWALGMATSYNELLVVTVPATMASTVLYTLSSSLMSLAVDEGNTGTAISISHATRSTVGIIAPIIGGYMYEHSGFQGVGNFAAQCCLLTTLCAVLTRGNFAVMELRKTKKVE
mmetsp:Transcript_9684/g.17035  ORF Transcript_9684/g.17035 Transcript_9684/m.17035 type:complete len:427 (-) Transcript_9684:19-1299(-)